MEADATLAGKKVLIIEDDPLLHNLLTSKIASLQEKGLSVFPVSNAEDGLSKAREIKPDLILLDLILPTMNGFDFLEQLRKDEALKSTSVVILSNLSGEKDKERAKSLGVTGYLVKANFSLSEISEVIQKLLHGEKFQAPEGGDHGIKYL